MKCKFPNDEKVYIGDIELDPCVYEVVEVHHNVTVRVLRCKNCGHVEVEWTRDNNDDDDFDPECSIDIDDEE